MTPAATIEVVLVVVIAIGLIVSYLVADYGRNQGFPFWPLYISALFLGFPLVLLAVVVGAGPKRAAVESEPEWDEQDAPEAVVA